MKTEFEQFPTASEMSYANNAQTEVKAKSLYEKLDEYLEKIKQEKSLFFNNDETVYIPDCHGDFVHLMITLYRHGIINKDLNLSKDFQYVFLGDFYDRAPDADLIDFWLNNQIKNKREIYRLIGNHEMAFFERDLDNYPIIFPSQDSIKDISNDFQITENLLKNLASGNIIAAYVDLKTLYIHSYAINEDFTELGLDPNTGISNFAIKLNERLKTHSQHAYDLFCEQKKIGKYDWKLIIKSFHDDPLFNIYRKKNDISTSFLWRRTGLPTLNIFPMEIDADIPNDVYQIVGHTPIFSFNLPKEEPINKPFVASSKNGTGKVQFSDVGIGYYYKENDFERPEVVIKNFLLLNNLSF